MPCNHRFINELLPQWRIEYLFIGTFNPCWDFNNASQADFFYGRTRNHFWKLLPDVFGGESLKHNSKEQKISYLENNNIGLTDLISGVLNADKDTQEDINNLTMNFSDNILNTYELEFNTQNIIRLIDRNITSLRGVYLTRSTLNNINQIRNAWLEIENHCSVNNINTNRLLTPARNYTNRKVQDWQSKIIF
jgi:hypothetical protein